MNTKQKKLKISYIEIKNIMGVKSLEFMPGKINMIEGKNGQGKTSVLKALQGVIGGGHDARLLRNDEDGGEVVVVFNNGYRLEKKVGREKSDAVMMDERGKKIGNSKSLLKSMIDAVGVNPVQILTASKKDRVKLLLDSVPMETPYDEIEKATGLTIEHTPLHPMQVIDEYRKKFYDDRTDTNRFLKEKTIMVGDQRASLPRKASTKDLSEELSNLLEEKEREETGLRDQEEATKVLLDREIERLRKDRESKIAAIHEEYEVLIDKARAKADAEIKELRDKVMPMLTELTQNISEVKNQQEASEDAARLLESVKKGEQEIKEMQEEADGFTAVIDKLDKIKAGLLKNLPIPGLEVLDGDIYLDGVAFDSVNKAKRVQFALAIAGLRDSQIPVVCVDDLESLDSESLEIFHEEALKTDMQFFVTRVTNDPELTINTEAK